MKFLTLGNLCVIFVLSLFLIHEYSHACATMCYSEYCCESPVCGVSFFSIESMQDSGIEGNRFLSKMLPSENVDDFSKKNIDEWAEWFHNNINKNDLKELINDRPIADIDSLIFALKNNSNSELSPLNKKILAQVRDHHLETQMIGALYYLGFAKRVQPLATAAERDSWEDSEATFDVAGFIPNADKLVVGAEKQMKNVSDVDLKRRYELQILRLYFFTKRYVEAERFFRGHVASFQGQSAVALKARDLFIGSLYRQENYADANYELAKFYLVKPDSVTKVVRYFHPNEEKDWGASLARCKSGAEKEALWTLMGLKFDGLRAMKEIYSINPQSQFLSILFFREIKKVEEGQKFQVTYDQDPKNLLAVGGASAVNKKNDDVLDMDLKPVLTVVEQIMKDKFYSKQFGWKLGLAYLRSLNKDYRGAAKLLAGAKSLIGTKENLKSSFRVIDIFNFISSLRMITPETESRLVEELEWLDKAELPEAKPLKIWASHRLRAVYKSKGEIAKGLLLTSYNSIDELKNNKTLDSMIFIEKKKKTKWEAYLVSQYNRELGHILDIKALNLFFGGNLKEAASVYFNQQSQSLTVANADPFLIHNIDCHDCDIKKHQLSSQTLARSQA